MHGNFPLGKPRLAPATTMSGRAPRSNLFRASALGSKRSNSPPDICPSLNHSNNPERGDCHTLAMLVPRAFCTES